MKARVRRIIPVILLVLIVVVGVIAYFHGKDFAVLNPKGTIAAQERRLIFTAALLALIVIIPVFTMLGVFAWRYREGNTKARYSPELDGNRWAEAIWWLVPTILIIILSVITWRSSHALDPFRPLNSTTPPLNVQVVALDWKWLFIYPNQGIATVNFLEIPVNTPVNFEITSDAPMNSFWIPQLGGQIYAMPGMSTQLHLMATSTGDFDGRSANISGAGFSGMTFVTRSASGHDFDQWAASVQQGRSDLTTAAYNSLSRPSQNNSVASYSRVAPRLYDTIVLKYMTPQGSSAENNYALNSMPGMQGMGQP